MRADGNPQGDPASRTDFIVTVKNIADKALSLTVPKARDRQASGLTWRVQDAGGGRWQPMYLPPPVGWQVGRVAPTEVWELAPGEERLYGRITGISGFSKVGKEGLEGAFRGVLPAGDYAVIVTGSLIGGNAGDFSAGTTIHVLAVTAIPEEPAPNEKSAERSLAALVDAERCFLKADYDGDGTRRFAQDPQALFYTKDARGDEVQLIPESLAGGDQDGYGFLAMGTYNAAGEGDPRSGFAYCAVPISYGRTGRRKLIVRHTGEIWWIDAGDDKPVQGWTWAADAALERAGWKRVR
jgi:hypothetical protein